MSKYINQSPEVNLIRGPASHRHLTSLTWGVTTTGGTGAAHAVLQPGGVGEGVSLVWSPSRRQTLLDTQ